MNKIAFIPYHTVDPDDGKTYFIISVTVDGKPIVDFEEDYALDIHALLASVKSSGDHFLLTCCCGDPYCGGIYKPVKVIYSETSVSWSFEQPIVYAAVFGRRQFNSALQAFRRQLHAIFKDEKYDEQNFVPDYNRQAIRQLMYEESF
jgi:hypothetical protein